MTSTNKQTGLPPITVFTKPWKGLDIEALADKVLDLGFDGVEFPVRKGFQVDPESIATDLPAAAKVFESRGLKIYSVATDLTAEAIRACGAAGVPVLRTMLRIDAALGYMENVERFRSRCRELSPIAKEAGVSIGLQNHCDSFACSSLSIIHAIEPLDSKAVSAVLDVGHTGLEGEREDIAIDIAWERLSMLNLKNGLRFTVGTDGDGVAVWNRTWVSAKEGYTSWTTVISELGKRGFDKPICITAEYKNADQKMCEGDEVVQPLRDDLGYLKELIAKHYSVEA
tara:strand:- start:269 stop:1120 length:852 start_codon:yes stop_codon:yes gene_type:complete